MKLVSVFSKGEHRAYEKGQVVLYQGEKIIYTFKVTKGFVKVYDIDSTGNEKVLLILGEGNIFPVLQPTSVNTETLFFYQALTDIELEVVPAEDFRKELNQSHTLALDMLDYFSALSRDLLYRVECIEATGAKHKIARVLIYLCRHHGEKRQRGNVTISVPLTHKLISDMAGMSRETASVLLKEMEGDKAFRINKEGYFVVNEQKMNDLLDT